MHRIIAPLRVVSFIAILAVCPALASVPDASAQSRGATEQAGADGRTETADSLQRKAMKLLEAGDYLGAEPIYAQAVALLRATRPKADRDLLVALNNHAFLLSELGRQEEAARLHEEVLAGKRSLYGGTDPSTLTSMNNYASVLTALGRYQEAAALLEEVLRVRRARPGGADADTVLSINNYAAILGEMGRLREAERLYAEALDLSDRLLGPDHAFTLGSLNNNGTILVQLGQLDKAERLLLRSLTQSRAVRGDDHPETIGVLNNYAKLIQQNGRPVEATPLLSEALRLAVQKFGAASPTALAIEENLASALFSSGRLEEGLAMARTVLEQSRETLGENHPDTLLAMGAYARMLIENGRAADADPVAVEALSKSIDLLGEDHPLTIDRMNRYALVLQSLDDTASAEKLFVRALKANRMLRGNRHPEIRIGLTNLAYLYLDTPGRSQEAIGPAREIVATMRQARRQLGFTPQEERRTERTEQGEQDSFRLLANAAWAQGPGLTAAARSKGSKLLSRKEQEELKGEAFAALQDAMTNAAGKAVTLALAREAAGDLGPLAKEREDLSRLWAQAESAWLAALGPSGDAAEMRRKDLRDQLDEIESRIAAIDQTLRTDAPAYFDLIRPAPLALEEAKAVLAADEAVLLVVPTGYGTHTMLITDEGLQWSRSDWSYGEIDAAVRRLLWDVGGSIEVEAVESAQWENEGDGVYPFAFSTAHALYQQIIAPVAEGLKGKRHVFFAASGSLSSLPFGMLVSEMPAGQTGDPGVLRSAKWFADAHALVRIPSLQSLAYLRKYRSAAKPASGRPFVGFGDPLLEGVAEQRGTNRSTRGAGRMSGQFDRIFSASVRGRERQVADTTVLRQMARLPGTASELQSMWSQFDRPSDALFLAQQATETVVRKTPMDATVIAFATHGLLAGDVGGVAEPGLVLTPPDQANETDDGYLSMSEIASLKINAEWLVLSACNTAASDGTEGAPGLSGLARSFFYAGAQTILASHWPVRDDVAAELTVRTLAILKANPALSRAEAFQQAMRDVRNDERADGDSDTWAHPSAWAPFSLIGDGAR